MKRIFLFLSFFRKIAFTFFFIGVLFSCTKPAQNDLGEPAAGRLKPVMVTIENSDSLNGLSYDKNSAIFQEGILNIFSESSAFFKAKLKGNKNKKHIVMIEAKGSEARGQGAKIVFFVNGAKLSEVEFKKSDFTKTKIEFESGDKEVDIQLSFINDFYDEKTKEDRNFFLKSMLVE